MTPTDLAAVKAGAALPMKTAPYLFKPYMVRALIDGRKTETRRLPRPEHASLKPGDVLWVREEWRTFVSLDKVKPSEIWGPAAERGAGIRYAAGGSLSISRGTSGRTFVADYADSPLEVLDLLAFGKRRPAMFMPRWACRLCLTVTAVEFQRLQDISEREAVAEGCVEDWADGVPVWYVPGGRIPRHGETARDCYRILWDHINGPGAWERNPAVTVIRFKVERRNPDHPITEGQFHVEA